MSPAELAAQLYQDPGDVSFRELVEAHLLGGYVHSTPEGFVLARPVDSKADEADIVNPWVIFPREQCDTWWIYLAAGDLASLLPLFPYPLPFIGWQRCFKGGEHLKFYRFESARKALTRKV